MRVLVTGGAGFIGRWVVHRFLEAGDTVWAVDNFLNGSRRNLAALQSHPRFGGLIDADIRNPAAWAVLFERGLDLCVHLAATIVVQRSIDDPAETFDVDVAGTFALLERARRHGVRFVFTSTCMVYDRLDRALSESDPAVPRSPYAAAKIAGENLSLSYYHAYGLPTVVLRPFNTYGPFQKTNQEGGVVSRFLASKLRAEPLEVFGDGTQTRDLMYVEDCADFVYRASLSTEAAGEVVNAGTGVETSINELAASIAGQASIRHVAHPHPRSEIPRLVCNAEKARRLLGWESTIPLSEGLARTADWLAGELARGAEVGREL